MEKLNCRYCRNTCVKNGFHSNGKQRFKCISCGKKQLKEYCYNAYRTNLNEQIIQLTKEGVGIRSTSRILKISASTLLQRILKIASTITQPKILFGQTYELDELRTYLGCKQKAIWITYAINSGTKAPVCYKVGRRNKKNLGVVTETLLISKAKKIFTDKLPLYKSLIDKQIHSTKFRGTNHIERNHLTLRTHLKRLHRRTICFSKSVIILSAIIKIYFWG